MKNAQRERLRAMLLEGANSPMVGVADRAYFDELRACILKQVSEGIARGERAIEGGNLVSHTEAKDRLARWLK